MIVEYQILRVLCAFFSGYLLSLSGSLVQQTTQNSLAGPSTLGMNSFVVLVILINTFMAEFMGGVANEFVSLMLFLGSILVAAFFLKNRDEVIPSSGVEFEQKVKNAILLGLCFNLFVGAVFSLMHFFFMANGKPFPTELWFGNFRQLDHWHTLVLGLITLGAFATSRSLAQNLRAMSFGPEVAMSLNIPLEKTARKSYLISLIAVGTVTCFFGVFAFLGLIVPHVLRQFEWFKRNSARELTIGALLAGFVLMLLDQACYYLTYSGSEFPVGLISSVVGSLLLLVLILRIELPSK